MPKPAYERILLKLGGEALAAGREQLGFDGRPEPDHLLAAARSMNAVYAKQEDVMHQALLSERVEEAMMSRTGCRSRSRKLPACRLVSACKSLPTSWQLVATGTATGAAHHCFLNTL